MNRGAPLQDCPSLALILLVGNTKIRFLAHILEKRRLQYKPGRTRGLPGCWTLAPSRCRTIFQSPDCWDRDG